MNKHSSNVFDAQTLFHELNDHLDLATFTSFPRIWNRDRSILFDGRIGNIIRCIVVGHDRIDTRIDTWVEERKIGWEEECTGWNE